MEAYKYNEGYYKQNQYGAAVKAYGYVRLSKDEYGEKKESLENQKDIIRRFASDRDINLITILEDDDISGYKFKQRDGLEELRRLIVAGKCNMVIAKDLSRLGRDNANILLLVDFFEDHDVRYILSNDSFDSLTGDRSMLGIKAWYNDFYGRDISKKMRGTLHEIQKKVGLVILPPYGYKKIYNETGERYVEVDEYAGNVVRQIFNWFIEGYGVKNISIKLNIMGYQTPNSRNQELYKKEFSKNSTGLWYHSSVRRMLSDESYIGILVNRKTEIKKISTQMKRKLPEEVRIRHENYFEPLIDEDVFYRVQKLLEVRSKGSIRTKGTRIPHLFTGFIKCGECGAALIFNASKKKINKENGEKVVYGGYICGHFHKFGRVVCTRHSVNERILKENLLQEIKRLTEVNIINFESVDLQIARLKKNQINHDVTIVQLENKLNGLEEKISNFIIEKNEGRIPESMANKFIEKATLEYNQINEQILKHKDIKSETKISKDNILKSFEILKSIAEKGDIQRQDIELLIERITVYENEDGKSLEFEWKAPFDTERLVSDGV